MTTAPHRTWPRRLPAVVAGLAVLMLLSGCFINPAPSDPTEPVGSSQGAGSRSDSSASATASADPQSSGSPTATATTAPTTEPLLSDKARREFTQRFGSGAGLVVAPLDGGAPFGVEGSETPYAWSTIKPLIVAGVLQDAGGPDGLSANQRNLIRRALSSSDNEAAATLYAELGRKHGGVAGAAAYLDELLAKAGDKATRVSTKGRDSFSTYGQTSWSLEKQALFFSALARGCVLDKASTKYLLDEMGHVVADQSWGLGRIDAPAYKGGWGPDPDGQYLVRQVGIVEALGGGRYVVAIASRPSTGTFEAGQSELTEIASWLDEQVDSAPAAADCQPGVATS